MAEMYLALNREEIHKVIPYNLVCMARYGSSWNTMRRKRRWFQVFTEEERNAAEELFKQAHKWAVGSGALGKVQMSYATYFLWQKLGAFCSDVWLGKGACPMADKIGEMFLDMVCPKCGRHCGNGGKGMSVRCQCGWTGGLSKKDARLLEEFYQHHLERNKRKGEKS